MGAWGPAIFSDDIACDIRDAYRDLVGEGLTGEQATDALLDEFGEAVNDMDDGPVFWFALAATQWKCGRLEERVKQKALSLLDAGEDLPRWEEDPAQQRERAKVLRKLCEQITSPQPPMKKIRRRYRDACEWDKGELIAYQLLSGRWIVLHVIGYHTDKGGTCPVFDLINWIGDELPTIDQLKHAGYCDDPRTLGQPQPVVGKFEQLRRVIGKATRFTMCIGRISENELPEARIQRLNAKLPIRTAVDNFSMFLWRHLDQQFDTHFGLK